MGASNFPTFVTAHYDAADQLPNIWHRQSGGAMNTISQFQYGYDSAGNRTWVKRSHQSNKGNVYSYDAADQLTNVKYDCVNPDSAPFAPLREISYIFDAAGNRSNVLDRAGATTNTTSYAVNNLNQYTSVTTTRGGLSVTGTVDPGVSSNKWNASTAVSRGARGLVGQSNGAFAIPGVFVTNGVNNISVIVQDMSGNTATQSVNVTVVNGTTTLGYSANGNQTNDAVWAYVYDRENRLTAATNSTNRINYTYDALGRMTERRTSGASITTNRLYYAGWQMVAEYNGAGTIQRKYVCGPGIDEPVRMTSGATKYYFHPDGLGSVTDVTDNGGLKAESYSYDVYGTPTMYNGSGSVISTSALGNSLLFTGRPRDPDTTLYNYRYRYYSPSLGRFMQPDPIGIRGGLSLYSYVENGPVSHTDSFGLDAYVIYAPEGGPRGADKLGHTDIAVDDPNGGYWVGSAAYGAVSVRHMESLDQEGFPEGRRVYVLPNKDVDGSWSDNLIHAFLLSPKNTSLSYPYCSTYVAEAARAGGYDLGKGVTPRTLLWRVPIGGLPDDTKVYRLPKVRDIFFPPAKRSPSEPYSGGSGNAPPRIRF